VLDGDVEVVTDVTGRGDRLEERIRDPVGLDIHEADPELPVDRIQLSQQ